MDSTRASCSGERGMSVEVKVEVKAGTGMAN